MTNTLDEEFIKEEIERAMGAYDFDSDINFDCDIKLDATPIIMDKDFSEKLDGDLSSIDMEIKREREKQLDIIHQIPSYDSCTSIDICARKNYYIVHTKIAYAITEENKDYVFDNQGEKIIPPFFSAFPLDDKNFLCMQIDKKDGMITSIFQYCLQDNNWELVNSMKNVSFSYLAPLCDRDRKFLSEHLLKFANKNNSKMLYNYVKRQAMIDDYDEEYKDDSSTENFICIKKHISAVYSADLEYTIDTEGNVVSNVFDIARDIYYCTNDSEPQNQMLNKIYEQCRNSLYQYGNDVSKYCNAYVKKMSSNK